MFTGRAKTSSPLLLLLNENVLFGFELFESLIDHHNGSLSSSIAFTIPTITPTTSLSEI